MKKKWTPLPLVLALALLLAACGGENTASDEPQAPAQAEEDGLVLEACPAPEVTEPLSVSSVEKDGCYTARDEVLLYLTTYGDLPENYITTEEAQALGWTGGDLADAAPGRVIGGDDYDNQAGLLPEGPGYRICHVDTDGQTEPGAHQLAYAVDFSYIYFSEDGGESFRLIYRAP